MGPQQQHLFQTGFPPQLSGSPADMKEEACHELTYAWWAQGVCRVFDVSLCSTTAVGCIGREAHMAHWWQGMLDDPWDLSRQRPSFPDFSFFFICPLSLHPLVYCLHPLYCPTGQCKLRRSSALSYINATKVSTLCSRFSSSFPKNCNLCQSVCPQQLSLLLSHCCLMLLNSTYIIPVCITI